MNMEKALYEMNKPAYIRPTLRWVWVGLDDKVADGGIGITGSRTEDPNLPDNPWGSAKEEEQWTEDTWTSSPGNSKIWDNAW